MKGTRILSLFIAMSAMVNSIQAQTLINNNASNLGTPVKGTTMATLRNAVEVLQMLPGITVTADKQIVVDGQLSTAIYIGTHKVTSISELYSLVASKIETVEVHTTPGAEYGKDVQSVIKFNIIGNPDDGVTLSNELNLAANNKAQFNDELHLGYKHNKLNLGAHLSWSETRNAGHEREYVNSYVNKVLTTATITERDADTRERKIVAQADMGYEFSERHSISLFYRIESIPYHKEFPSGNTYNYTNVDPSPINFDSPTEVLPIEDRNTTPQSLHQINAEYHGKWGNWSIDIGHNSQWYKNENSSYKKDNLTNEYFRKSYKMRNYLKTSVPLWKGSLSLGMEHNIQHMDVLHRNPSDESKTAHALNITNTFADYISLSQRWGNFSATAGLRHELDNLSYDPYDDDGLYSYLNHIRNNNALFGEFKNKYPNWESRREGTLLKEGKITTRRNHFYPDLSMSYDVSDYSIVSLSFSRSYHIADPELSRIYLSDLQQKQDKLLHTEHIYNTTLSWWYDWMHLSATHNYYEDPLCVTNDSKNVYNGNSYHGIDMSLILAPRIGRWQPNLMVMYSKQWFDIELANGRNNLNRPRFTIHFNNTISLPKDWTIIANAEWFSKGDMRNVYYYNNDFVMNMSIQKELLSKHLSIALKVNNLFDTSYKDITTYNLASSGVSNGVKSSKQTTVTLSVKYTL